MDYSQDQGSSTPEIITLESDVEEDYPSFTSLKSLTSPCSVTSPNSPAPSWASDSTQSFGIPQLITLSDDEEVSPPRPSAPTTPTTPSTPTTQLWTSQMTSDHEELSDTGTGEDDDITVLDVALSLAEVDLESLCLGVNEGGSGTLLFGVASVDDISDDSGVVDVLETDVLGENILENPVQLQHESANIFTCLPEDPEIGELGKTISTMACVYANEPGIVDSFEIDVLGENIFENPIQLQHDSANIFTCLREDSEIDTLGETSPTMQSGSEARGSKEKSTPENSGNFSVGETSPQSRIKDKTPTRRKGKRKRKPLSVDEKTQTNEAPTPPKRRKKRGKAQSEDDEDYRPSSHLIKNHDVVAKKNDEVLILRRNPPRGVSAPTDCYKSRNNPRGNQSSEDITTQSEKDIFRERVFDRRGVVAGACNQYPKMSDPTWPADTLDRPTLDAVAEEHPPPSPTPPSWGTATHHLLQCVLAMLARFQTEGTVGIDHIASKLFYVKHLLSQLVERDGETTAVEGAGKPITEMEIETDEEDRSDSVTTVAISEQRFLDDLTGDEEVISSEEEEDCDSSLSTEVDAAWDEVVSLPEDQVSVVVYELLVKVRDVEKRFRDQSAVRFTEKLFGNVHPQQRRSHQVQIGPVPTLDDLEELLERASYVYRLTNQDVSEKDLNAYLSWAEGKEASD